MLHVVLFEPEIAGNAGNIARTCLAVGAKLHLIRPLGFRLHDEAVKRAGMDYWQEADVKLHASFVVFHEEFKTSFEQKRVFAFTTKAEMRYSETQFQDDDVLMFGPESRGLPENIRNLTEPLRIPMTDDVRSLNLAVSVGVVVYECWRQIGFSGE